MSNSNITLHFLQASRCIRTAWQLEELGLQYEVKFSPRENGVAPAEFKKNAGGLGKFPALEDGGDFFYESGNITEYLEDKYDTSHRLLPAPGSLLRYKILQWVHAAEGTFMLHGLSILYARWQQKSGNVEETVEGLSKNVVKDMDYLEATLEKSDGKFLIGDELTVADIMMEFSASFILARELGTKGKEWSNVNRWLKTCQDTPGYQKAVGNTGYQL